VKELEYIIIQDIERIRMALDILRNVSDDTIEMLEARSLLRVKVEHLLMQIDIVEDAE